MSAREDYIGEAWRIIERVLQADATLYPCEPGTWGPSELVNVTPPAGWHDPIVARLMVTFLVQPRSIVVLVTKPQAAGVTATSRN